MSEAAGETANIYRVLADVAKQVGQVAAITENKVSYRDMMTAQTEARKDFVTTVAAEVGNVEKRFEARLALASEQIISAVSEKVAAAIAQQEAAKAAAREEARETDADTDRRVRVAMRTGWIGASTGILGIGAGLAQYFFGGG